MREITRYDESCTQNYQYLSYVYNNCYMQIKNGHLCYLYIYVISRRQEHFIIV